MSILSKIKQGVANSGSSMAKIVFVKADSKTRVRFLQEIEDAVEVIIHDSFDQGINALCRTHLGEDCPYCETEGLRTRPAYVWSVWEVENKEVKLFVGYANNFNPLPSLVSMGETYGTLMDRDYVIQRDGKGTNTRYSVVPMDKVKFKNTKAKPYPKAKLIDILEKAYPVNEADETGKKNGKKKSKKQEEPEEDEDEDEDENDYENMSPKELYMECIERGLTAKKKQKAEYYIKMLEKDDEKNKDDDEWEEEDDDEEGDW